MNLKGVALWGFFVLLSGCEFNASCGNNSNILNTNRGEKVIGEWLEKQSMPATSVTCPRDIKMQKDHKFLCQAELKDSDNLTIDIEITQTTEKGDIHMEHASNILPSSIVERGVAGTVLDQTKKKVVVDCGLRVRLSVPKSTFVCTAKGESAQFQVEITMHDEPGSWQAKKL
jgi:hypothetical protein